MRHERDAAGGSCECFGHAFHADLRLARRAHAIVSTNAEGGATATVGVTEWPLTEALLHLYAIAGANESAMCRW